MLSCDGNAVCKDTPVNALMQSSCKCTCPCWIRIMFYNGSNLFKSSAICSFCNVYTSGNASDILHCSKDTDSSAVEDDIDNPDYKAWQEKFRCTNLKGTKKHSVGTLSF